MAKIIRGDEAGRAALEASSIVDALRADTLLGRELVRLYRSAVNHRKRLRVGDYGLDELLRECYDARDDKSLCGEAALQDKYPQWAAMPISLVSFKVNILVSLIRESLADVANAPFIIDPTPEPEIPRAERERLLDGLEEAVLVMAAEVEGRQEAFLEAAAAEGIDPALAAASPEFPQLDADAVSELVRQRKIKARQAVRQHAQEQALSLQRDLYDKTVEGGYRKAVIEFADDFATYPFGCMHGPVSVYVPRVKWDGDRLVEELAQEWRFERVSPFDFFWTADSTTTQDGTAVFIRKRVGIDYLYRCLDLADDAATQDGYRKDALVYLRDMAEDGALPRDWLAYLTTNPEIQPDLLRWKAGDTAELLICYARVTGAVLEEYGFKDIEPHKTYEIQAEMCGGQVIRCLRSVALGSRKRPVFTASFESRNNSIVGVGLAQKLLPLHKAYRAVVHLMMYNLGLSSEPITEFEISRLLQYMPDSWIDDPQIAPGMTFPTDGDRMGNGSRAVKFTQIPNTTDSALRLASYIFDLSHIISNIPAALHGQPVGSGANRTVRGLLTLQGNTLKPIHSALMNLDLGIIEPMVTMLYHMLVMFDDDFEYSGDCVVVAKGASGMIQREMDKQAAMENLQILGQLGGSVNPEIVNRTVTKLLLTAGVLEEGEAAMIPQAPAAQDAPPAAPAAQEQTPPQG